MTKDSKVKQQVKQVTTICLSLMIAGTIALLVRFYVVAHGCPVCFYSSLANMILEGVLAEIVVGYAISLLIIGYKAKQNKKEVKSNDRT